MQILKPDSNKFSSDPQHSYVFNVPTQKAMSGNFLLGHDRVQYQEVQLPVNTIKHFQLQCNQVDLLYTGGISLILAGRRVVVECKQDEATTMHSQKNS